LREAEAELAKARIQLRKGPILSEIDRLKNQTRAESAEARLASLGRANQHHEQAEAAALRVLELKQERQQVALERIQNNIEKLVIRAPLDGMVALENIWRSGSMGPAQEGDQVWPGQTLLRIFDPSEMIVDCPVSEADGGALADKARGKVYLDAYPDLVFDAYLESASPVATSGLDNPIKSFAARFRIQQPDARLLPDLSAAVELELPR